ncbi:MAG: metallophosphoesterase [Polyangiales bacterium]
MDRIQAAISRARSLAAAPVPLSREEGRAPTRWFAMGDPQASLSRFFQVLDRAGLLDESGGLRHDVGLLSIGDHFDYGSDAAEASADGSAILHWLASHPPDRVVLLAGNHDIARVTELAHETDATFTAARTFAGSDAEFFERFPKIPTRELAKRDYSAFTEAQRTSVQTLLSSRRFALAAVAPVQGVTTLFVHAGLTERERTLLQVPLEPHAIAQALNDFLDERVSQVKPQWQRAELAALDLAPLHIGGDHGIEGGGFLYHRPANLERKGMADPTWERDTTRPRRYDPRNLPRGLVQAVGHTSHKKCRKELEPWITARAHEIKNGGLRTLRVGDEVVYDAGIHPPRPGEALVYMIDSSMSDHEVAEVPLLPIGAPKVTRGSV